MKSEDINELKLHRKGNLGRQNEGPDLKLTDAKKGRKKRTAKDF